MSSYLSIMMAFLGFVVIAAAAERISFLFQKIRLPLITGFIVMGIIAGPFVLGMIDRETSSRLDFINDISLAIIAFAAGAELYLKELRGQISGIIWMTFGQLVITFVIGAAGMYLLSDYIPFMQDMSTSVKVAVGMLAGTIFVARSPSSAIAVINEMRARGPFTKTAIGVTVLKDVLVIILFAVCFSSAESLIADKEINVLFVGILLAELLLSFLAGYLLGRLLAFFMSFSIPINLKIALILITGFGVFIATGWIEHYGNENFGIHFHMEPLLICIIGSFVVTNFSKYRVDFARAIEIVSPYIFIAFFTLIGLTMSLDVLSKVWMIALMLFGLRILGMILGGITGSALSRDPVKYYWVSWMPYVTQAGVAIGLAKAIEIAFPSWGVEFSTVIIALIVLNQIVGPPLFKWAISFVGEAHTKAITADFDGVKDAFIFGLEGQSAALARQLKKHGWEVKLVCVGKMDVNLETAGLEVVNITEISKEAFEQINAKSADAMVMMLTDEENFELCQVAYEHYGTKDLIVRLNSRQNMEGFVELGALIVDPHTAIVGLLDHFVRSPNATSLLLGQESNQDTVELEVFDESLHGVPLRDIRLPSDVLVLSIKRGDNLVLSHGYTCLRLGDLVTLVGSIESIEKTSLKFGN